MGFIYDDQAVSGKRIVPFYFLEQDTVGHDLYPGPLIGTVLKAHFIAYRVGDVFPHLPGDKLGHRDGGDPPRLGHSDHQRTRITRLKKNLGNLGCFTGPGRALHNDHLLIGQGLENSFLLFINR